MYIFEIKKFLRHLFFKLLEVSVRNSKQCSISSFVRNVIVQNDLVPRCYSKSISVWMYIIDLTHQMQCYELLLRILLCNCVCKLDYLRRWSLLNTVLNTVFSSHLPLEIGFFFSMTLGGVWWSLCDTELLVDLLESMPAKSTPKSFPEKCYERQLKLDNV